MAIARTHRPVWNAERCLPCGACTRRCPSSVFVEQIREPDSLRGQVASTVRFSPGPDRPDVPPCRAACPLGQDVPGYVAAVARGDLEGAARRIYETNPLPSACGRLCLRACEHACVRAGLDTPVQIRAIKCSAVELAGARPVPACAPDRGIRVAVIGSGPAGLSAAFFLRLAGFQVTIYEAEDEPGGMLRWAIPDFEMPRDVLDQEITAILDLGVELKTGMRIDSYKALTDLGTDSVVLATGAGRGLRLGLAGENLPGCTDAVSFARLHARGQGPKLDAPVVVVGGSNMAVAAARMARRAAAPEVVLMVSRPRDQLAVDQDRLALAEAEGIQLLFEERPIALRATDRLTAVVCAPLVYGPPDEVGRRWPEVPSRSVGQPMELEAGTLVAAEDREPDLDWLPSPHTLRGPLGTIAVAGESMRTKTAGVFAAGDVVSGARNSVEAIALGRRAAREVERYQEEIS